MTVEEMNRLHKGCVIQAKWKDGYTLLGAIQDVKQTVDYAETNEPNKTTKIFIVEWDDPTYTATGWRESEMINCKFIADCPHHPKDCLKM